MDVPLTEAEHAMLALCGFERSTGWLLDADGQRWDDDRAAVEECYAMADTGYVVTSPADSAR